MSARAWLAWASMVAVMALTVTNPLYQAITVLGVVIVGAVTPPATASGALRPFLVAGVGVVVFSAFVSLVNGTPGSHVLFTVPGPDAPSWLGGLRFGGPVTREGLLLATSRGLGLLAIVGAFAVVTTAVSPGRLLRATPAALAEAGLVVTVGLALLPATLEDLLRLREAERLRGRDLRWWQWPTLLVPAVLGGLERATRLAEAMETRGLGQVPPGKSGRLGAAAAAPLCLLAAYLWVGGGEARPFAALPAVAAAAGLAWWHRSATRAHKTTRLRDEPGGTTTFTVAAALGILVVLAAIVVRPVGLDLGYNPLTDGLSPSFAPAGAGFALLAAWPFALLLAAPRRPEIAAAGPTP